MVRVILGLNLGFGGRNGVVDVLLISFGAYCASFGRAWLWRCMSLFILPCSACFFSINSPLGVCSDLRELGIVRELARTIPRLRHLDDRISG